MSYIFIVMNYCEIFFNIIVFSGVNGLLMVKVQVKVRECYEYQRVFIVKDVRGFDSVHTIIQHRPYNPSQLINHYAIHIIRFSLELRYIMARLHTLAL